MTPWSRAASHAVSLVAVLALAGGVTVFGLLIYFVILLWGYQEG